MTIGSLFAGIGGFELAATWAGIKPLWSNEIDKFACKVLRKNFSHEIIEKDIRKIGKENLAPVDIISGGFPCQPFSTAGKRKGTEDDRYLWPEMLRVIRELKPSYIIGENVAGLIEMALDEVLFSLEDQGYKTESFNIPAASIGADHIRERIWVLAHSSSESKSLGLFDRNGTEAKKRHKNKEIGCENRNIVKMGTEIDWGIYEGKQFSEPKMVRISNGVSSELDEIKGLGNAIVPQIAYELFMTIIQTHEKPL